MTVPHLHLLGALRLKVGERLVPLAPGPPTTLLGCLALRAAPDPVLPIPEAGTGSGTASGIGTRGHAVSRSRLAGLLWPDVPEQIARRNLSDALYRLRRAIGDDSGWLSANENTLGLESIWLDVDEFRARAGSTEMDDWRAALDLYAGDLLEDLDAEWVIGPRVELRDRYVSLLECVCTALADSGELPEALSLAHRWTLADPYNETAHRAAMRLYARLGRHAAALQQYDKLARLLADELDIEPLPETRALAETLRADATRSTLHPPRPFVGRRRERAALLGLVERAHAGKGCLALVEGEAGIGKTRLLEEVASGAAWRGLAVVWGRARGLAGVTPYAPLDQALRSAITSVRADQLRDRIDPAIVETLSGLLPRLQTTLASPSSGGKEGEPHATRAAQQPDFPAALAECLCALASIAPHCFLLDDAQWAGAGFWECIEAVGPRAPAHRLLVILCYRGGQLRDETAVWQRVQAIDRDLAPPRITLYGLAPDECAELAAELGQPLEAGSVAGFHRRTGGNPLFIREALELREPESESLSSLIERRLAGLSPAERTALEAGAVLGREFVHGAWQSVAGANVVETVPALVAGGFLGETDQGYAFQHDQAHERVYRLIPPDRLRDLHGRAGQALRRERADPATLAWHFEQAEAWPEAVRYHREAGDRAHQLVARTTAVEHYNRGLALLHHLPEPDARDLRLDLLGRRLTVFNFLRAEPDWDRAIGELETAAREANETPALLQAVAARMMWQSQRSDWSATRETAQQTIALAREIGDRAAEARAEHWLGWHFNNLLRRPADALPHFERAAELAGAAGDAKEQAEALENFASALLFTGRCGEAQAKLQEVFRLAEGRPEFVEVQANTLQTLAMSERFLARWEQAWTAIQRTLDLKSQLDDPWMMREGLVNAAYIASHIGQHAEARRIVEALQALRRSGRINPTFAEWLPTQTRMADVFTLAGDLTAAESLLDEIKPLAEGGATAEAQWRALTSIGRLRLAQNRPEEAAPLLARAVRLWRENMQSVEVAAVLLHALAAARGGDPAAARASLRLAEETLRLTDVAEHNVLLHYLRYELSGDAADLQAARAEIQRQASLITDGRLLADFLNSVLVHREIESRWRALRPAPPPLVVRLARAAAPLGRPLAAARGDYVAVRWTVDAGQADAEILLREGRVALRRRRLRRLIEEARAQNASPTDADLARALDVNIRTVERDMAALRSEGQAVPTRRRKM